jgi:hypothetical protein
MSSRAKIGPIIQPSPKSVTFLSAGESGAGTKMNLKPNFSREITRKWLDRRSSFRSDGELRRVRQLGRRATVLDPFCTSSHAEYPGDNSFEMEVKDK